MNDPQPPKKRMGCLGQGLIALAIIILLLVVIGGGGGWLIYNKGINGFTSDRPANVTVDQPSDVAFQQAETQLRQLRTAVRNKTKTTMAFSATDLNALIARDPGFAGMRNKTRVDMSGNDMILDLSAPLDTVPLPRFKGRWFNGRVTFHFTYDLGQFSFATRALETNGHRMEDDGMRGFSSSFLRNFSASYTRSFNQGFRKGQDRNAQGREFWDHIKTMSIQNGQLVVTTQPGP